MSRKPNIVIILADDMGYGDVGAFGNPHVQTPHIDRLCTEGVQLNQHYSGSPMCAPARAALLTGRYPHRTGAIDVVEVRGLDRIGLRERTMADVFKAADYVTGIFGKWHNGAIDTRYHPTNRGFDEFVGFQGGISEYWDWIIQRNGRYHEADGRYLTDVLTEEAVQFIRRHENRSFFLYVPYNAPHSPFQAPEEDISPFRDTELFTEAVSTIYGMNRRMDAGIGRLLETLEECGLSENTLVLFTSDNGPWFTGSGDGCTRRYNGCFNGSKGSVLEGGIRVPAVLRWPTGLDAPGCVHELVHFADWLPTLAAAAGIDHRPHLPLDGRSVLPVLRGEPAERPPLRFWQWNRYTPVRRCNAAMRDGPWKLVWPEIPEAMHKLQVDNERSRYYWDHPESLTEIWTDPVERTLSPPEAPLLFNLDEDPCEQRDLAACFPERVSAMKTAIENWFEAVETERRASAG